MILSLLGVSLALLLPPWSLLGVAACVGGTVMGLRARRRVGHAAGTRVATTAVVVGLAGALLASSLSALGFAYHRELDAYQECQRGANTEAARADCQQQLQDLRDRIMRSDR